MPRKKTEIIATETSQLSVFDYSGYSEEFKLKSYERKARIKANEQVATKAFYDIAQDVKAQHDEMNNYQDWLTWCDKELGYKARMSEQFLQISEELPQHVAVDKLPNSFRGLNALASALSKVDEETKEKILEQVEAKTEETGKALTEKQINELPEIKRLKEELKAQQEAKKKLEEDLKEAKQGELFFQEKLDKKIEDYNDLQDSFVQKLQEIKGFEETVANQNKQIKELNSLTSQLEKRQQEIAEKEELVMSQFANLSETVDSEVRAKLQKEKDLALAEVEKQKNDLKKEQQKVKKELEAVQAEKDRFTRANKWVELMTEYNLEFAKMCDRLKYISSELNNAPKFEDLGEYKDTVKQTAQMQMDKFSDNLDAFGKFNSRIIMAISRIDKNPLKAYDVVATEVSDE